MDNYDEVRDRYDLYTVPSAAALWCDIAPGAVEERLREAEAVGPGVFRHPDFPGLEARCRAIHAATLLGTLPVNDEHGNEINIFARKLEPDQRRVTVSCLKWWIKRTYPLEKSPFYFRESEDSEQLSIDAETHEALAAELENIWREHDLLLEEKTRLEEDNRALRSKLDGIEPTDARSETTYLNIVGALIDLLLGKSPEGRRLSVFNDQNEIIDSLLAHHEGKQGIARRTLEKKFPQAKRSLKSAS